MIYLGMPSWEQVFIFQSCDAGENPGADFLGKLCQAGKAGAALFWAKIWRCTKRAFWPPAGGDLGRQCQFVQNGRSGDLQAMHWAGQAVCPERLFDS